MKQMKTLFHRNAWRRIHLEWRSRSDAPYHQRWTRAQK